MRNAFCGISRRTVMLMWLCGSYRGGKSLHSCGYDRNSTRARQLLKLRGTGYNRSEVALRGVATDQELFAIRNRMWGMRNGVRCKGALQLIEAPLLQLQLVGAVLEASASAAIAATTTTTTETTTATATAAGARFLWFGLIDSQRTSVHL